MKYGTVGAFVKAEILPKDMSVAAAARALGIGRQALHAFLSGKSKLSTGMAAKLGTAFGADPVELLKQQADLDARDDAEEKVTKNASDYLQITADQIEQWAIAKRISARASLPVLVRRLIHATTSDLTELDFPGDEEAERHGWDGEVVSKHGTGKVPKGRSGWELSISTDLPRKPTSDIDKREENIGAAIRKETTFVFVTPRSWPKKKDWAAKRRASGAWKDVRAYDSDDLAQWLETSIATQTWMAKQIGIPTDGVRTLDDCWSKWATVTKPNLSELLFEGGKKQNFGVIDQWLRDTANKPLVVVADSIAEGLAYLSTSLPEEIRNNSLVVSTTDALRRTAEATLNSVLIIDDKQAEQQAGPLFKTHRVIVVRLNTSIENERDVLLTQVDSETFRAALENMGLHEDVARLATQSARSPTILRRRLAISPELKIPAWADPDKQLSSKLIPILMAGAWTRSNKADREVVAALADIEYDKIEQDLAALFSIPDSPVWIVGNFRGIVCRRDALFAAHPCLLDKDLDRFFDWASLILSEDDPALDLDPEKRWAAPIYGKKRDISTALRDAIGEMLVLLAVHGDELTKPRLGNIANRVDQTVKYLLKGKEARELVALSSDFPHLAEASPNVFLQCIEEDLSSPDPQVLSLLRSVEAGFMDSPDRASLLWALELLAWDQRYYLRAIRILAKLSEIPIHDNWVNTPENSLESLISCWHPETTAELEGRIKALRLIAREFADVGWRRCLAQVTPGHKTLIPNSRPTYRDLGERPKVTYGERFKVIDAAWDTLFSWPALDSQKISDLINVTEGMQGRQKAKLIDIITAWQQSADDAEKAKAVEALQENGYSPEIVLAEDATVHDKSLKQLAEQLQPADVVSRYRWLFAEPYVREFRAEMLRENFNYEERKARISAQRDASVEAIFNELGIDGILRLLGSGNASSAVGHHLAKVINGEAIRTVILALLSSDVGIEKVKIDHCIEGLLIEDGEGSAIKLALKVIDKLLDTERGESESVLRLFLACPFNSKTWEAIDRHDEELAQEYWHKVRPSALQLSEGEVEVMVYRLLEAGRPRAAFHGLEYELDKIDATTLARLMEAIVAGGNEEPDAYQPNAYQVDQALGYLHDKKTLTVDQLARLEFVFGPLLHDSAHGLRNLERKIANNPASFVELVALMSKREDEGTDPERFRLPEDADRDGILDSVLHALTNVSLTPGTSEDGEINVDELIGWVREARKLFDELSRSEVGEEYIGELLSRCPTGTDGIWPHGAVRHAFEKLYTEVLSQGMQIGVNNSRGVVHEILGAGGSQERTLATKYQGWSDALASEFPLTSRMLSNIADNYLWDSEQFASDETVRRRLGHY